MVSRSRCLTAIASAALLFASCGGDGSRLETFTMEPGRSPGGTLVEGTIEGVGGCVVLVVPGEPPAALLFDSQYTATFPPLKVFDGTGTLVAEGGQHVWLGVEGNKQSASTECDAPRTWWVFSVSTTDPVAD